MADSGQHIAHGRGYTVAQVTITGGGGTGATTRAVLPFSDSGVGADARIDLKTSSVMFHTMIEGNDSNFLLDQDFRQVTLIKDPLAYSGSKITANTASVLDFMRLSSIVNGTHKRQINRRSNNICKGIYR